MKVTRIVRYSNSFETVVKEFSDDLTRKQFLGKVCDCNFLSYIKFPFIVIKAFVFTKRPDSFEYTYERQGKVAVFLYSREDRVFVLKRGDVVIDLPLSMGSAMHSNELIYDYLFR